MMDLMRHLGRAELTSFAGGAPANRTLEQNLWQTAPYTEADLQAQVNALASDGPQGAQVKSDIDSYLAGVNAYIAQVEAANDFPGEYDLTGQSIQPFTETDMIAIAAVVGGLFGSGGGEAMQSALVKEAAEAEYGVTKGDQVWSALREQNDPEATLTLHNGQSFPYGEVSGTPVPAAMPDPGTVTPVDMVQNATGSAAPSSSTKQSTAARAATAAKRSTATSAALAKLATKVPASLRARLGSKIDSVNGMFDNGALPGVDMPAPGQQHPGMSNALVVSGADSASGHPVAVFGPQTGYFAPQLLMMEEIQAPGLSARGVAFSGLNFYVEMGRGPSYAWSATSGEQGTADTFAVKLCNTDGSPATTSSLAYLDNGVCTPMQKLEAADSWSPTIADGTAAGSYDLVMYRTDYGLVDYTGEIDGAPVAYTVQRATYMHEAVSAIGFMMFNDPSVMSTPAGFESAAAQVGYDFNWFYVNSTDTAYYNSGQNPVRATGTDPNLPIWGTPANQWVGWDSSTDSSEDTPPSAHPNATDQDYFVSWNNKQAQDYSAADGNFSYGPVQRVDLLNQGISSYLATGAKFTRSALVPSDGASRGHRPARQGSASTAAPGDQQPAGHRPGSEGPDRRTHHLAGGRRDHRADQLRGHQLPELPGDPADGRLVAAAGAGGVRTGHGHRSVLRAEQRHAGQRLSLGRPADLRRRLRPVRRGPAAQGLGLPVRLVGLRQQGPAQRPRRKRPGPAAGPVLRHRRRASAPAAPRC